MRIGLRFAISYLLLALLLISLSEARKTVPGPEPKVYYNINDYLMQKFSVRFKITLMQKANRSFK